MQETVEYRYACPDEEYGIHWYHWSKLDWKAHRVMKRGYKLVEVPDVPSWASIATCYSKLSLIIISTGLSKIFQMYHWWFCGCIDEWYAWVQQIKQYFCFHYNMQSNTLNQKQYSHRRWTTKNIDIASVIDEAWYHAALAGREHHTERVSVAVHSEWSWTRTEKFAEESRMEYIFLRYHIGNNYIPFETNAVWYPTGVFMESTYIHTIIIEIWMACIMKQKQYLQWGWSIQIHPQG